jgi:hypothetical protein
MCRTSLRPRLQYIFEKHLVLLSLSIYLVHECRSSLPVAEVFRPYVGTQSCGYLCARYTPQEDCPSHAHRLVVSTEPHSVRHGHFAETTLQMSRMSRAFSNRRRRPASAVPACHAQVACLHPSPAFHYAYAPAVRSGIAPEPVEPSHRTKAGLCHVQADLARLG